tara:strand:- start:1212 stop:1745 length:534 start_codon:yes stop_codon:yes gene_type:complete
MNNFYKTAYDAGVDQALQDYGLEKEAIVQHLARGAIGAGMGAMTAGEGNRGMGALVGGVAGLAAGGAGSRAFGKSDVYRQAEMAGIGGRGARKVRQGFLNTARKASREGTKLNPATQNMADLSRRYRTAVGTHIVAPTAAAGVGAGLATRGVASLTAPPQQQYPQYNQYQTPYYGRR